MNERIKELLLQNKDKFTNGVTITNGEVYIHGSQENLEKLTELIVRECIEIVQPESYDGDAMTASLNAKVKQIKQRFGVE